MIQQKQHDTFAIEFALKMYHAHCFVHKNVIDSVCGIKIQSSKWVSWSKRHISEIIHTVHLNLALLFDIYGVQHTF